LLAHHAVGGELHFDGLTVASCEGDGIAVDGVNHTCNSAALAAAKAALTAALATTLTAALAALPAALAEKLLGSLGTILLAGSDAEHTPGVEAAAGYQHERDYPNDPFA
jgi:hypothetical protein